MIKIGCHNIFSCVGSVISIIHFTDHTYRGKPQAREPVLTEQDIVNSVCNYCRATNSTNCNAVCTSKGSQLIHLMRRGFLGGGGGCNSVKLKRFQPKFIHVSSQNDIKRNFIEMVNIALSLFFITFNFFIGLVGWSINELQFVFLLLLLLSSLFLI